jgi:hypothetical protein
MRIDPHSGRPVFCTWWGEDGPIIIAGGGDSTDTSSLESRIASIESRLEGKADRDHEHDGYATHEELHGYAPAEHQHDAYATHEEVTTEVESLVDDLAADVEAILAIPEDAPEEPTTEITPLPTSEERPSERHSGMVF